MANARGRLAETENMARKGDAMNFLLLAIGMVLLVKGADLALDSAGKLAQHLGVSAFTIGMTLVAAGTSAPELVIGVMSGLEGANQLTLGDVIGSSIVNITVVLGLTAVILPIPVQPLVSKREIPLSFTVQLLLVGLLFTGSVLSRSESLVLLAAMLVLAMYVGVQVVRMKKWNLPQDAIQEEFLEFLEDEEDVYEDQFGSESAAPVAAEPTLSPLRMSLSFIVGLAIMIGGAQLVVDHSITIAHSFGLSAEFIGITIVAFGTSLPELTASLVAAWRRKLDIAVGNIIGSNIFNILLVLGVSGAIHPINYSPGIMADLAVMLLATLMLWIPAWYKHNISRMSGLFLVAFYVGYITWKVINI